MQTHAKSYRQDNKWQTCQGGAVTTLRAEEGGEGERRQERAQGQGERGSCFRGWGREDAGEARDSDCDDAAAAASIEVPSTSHSLQALQNKRKSGVIVEANNDATNNTIIAAMSKACRRRRAITGTATPGQTLLQLSNVIPAAATSTTSAVPKRIYKSNNKSVPKRANTAQANLQHGLRPSTHEGRLASAGSTRPLPRHWRF